MPNNPAAHLPIMSAFVIGSENILKRCKKSSYIQDDTIIFVCLKFRHETWNKEIKYYHKNLVILFFLSIFVENQHR